MAEEKNLTIRCRETGREVAVRPLQDGSPALPRWAVGPHPLPPGEMEMVAAAIYTNHRGETLRRRILPVRLWFGRCEPWHPEPQWLLDALDVDKMENRTFALEKLCWESKE